MSRCTNLPYGAIRHVPVPADGNCMFHAFAELLTARGNRPGLHADTLPPLLTHTSLRKRVIEAHTVMEDLVPEVLYEPGVTPEQWRRRMQRDRIWGDDVALFLLCLLCRTRVAVHRVLKTGRNTCVTDVEHYPLPLASLKAMRIAPNDAKTQGYYQHIIDPICRLRTCFELRLQHAHYTPLFRVPERVSQRQIAKRRSAHGTGGSNSARV